MKTRKPNFLFITFAIVLSACAGSNIADQPNIEGITWVLSTYNGTRPIESAQPTLRFEDEQISGKTGCNHYGGSYQIKGDALNFSDLFNTEMACLDPEGVMEQEQTYLELLRAAQRIELNDGELTIFADPQQTLAFEIQQANSITPTPQPEQQSPIPPTPTAEIPNPTPTLAFEPPAGFNEYQDPVVGITVYIPESWRVTGIIEGQSAIFQSYPTDKYVGGEMLEPGDTKCDFNIRQLGTSVAELIQQWKSVPTTTIISEAEVVLQSGQPGIRMELDSMGRSILVISEINERVVVLTCFGDFAHFDEIAFTLKGGE